MSKLKISIILSLTFVIAIGSGFAFYRYFNEKNSADLAKNDQVTVIERNYNDFICGDGEDGHREYEVSQVEFSESFEIYPDEPLNIYSYQPFEKASELNDILNKYFNIALFATDGILAENDGYQNYAYSPTSANSTSNKSSYFLSSNYYTGKFSLNISRSTAEITAFVEQYASYDLTEQHSLMQASAIDFAEQFVDITGKLNLEYDEVVDISEGIYDEPDKMREYLYKGSKFYFTSVDNTTNLNLTPNYNTPLTYNDSAKTYFTVTVRPDGTICMAENLITQADIAKSGEKPPLTHEYLQKLSFVFTSLYENDTLVFDEISSITYNNYFGYTTIEPYITVKYHFLSKPDDVRETSFVYNLDWIDLKKIG